MKTYLIGYDLNKKGQDYADLIDAIKLLSPTWWHNLDSTWVIKSDSTASAIRDNLMSHIDDNDELLVVKLSGEGAWTGFSDNASKWLKDNL
ncbi:SinR family protein [Pedobacter gandavensis]|uniref:SinR family protein n=1 Tax=Pedobacter gandavensis TaxID=2679963 RepID=UPI00293174A9|nr:SinR family protein [Pedobacter gandavensis]